MNHGYSSGDSAGAPFDLNEKLGPWVVVAPQDDRLVAAQLGIMGERGAVARRLDAQRMGDPPELFCEFSRVLGFPSYFGHNWDALVDCLDDLHGDWHGNSDVAVVVDNADSLLVADFLPLFVSVLCQAAERANSAVDLDGDPLSRPAIALHFVLAVKEHEPRVFLEPLQKSGRSVIGLGRYVLVQ